MITNVLMTGAAEVGLGMAIDPRFPADVVLYNSTCDRVSVPSFVMG